VRAEPASSARVATHPTDIANKPPTLDRPRDGWVSRGAAEAHPSWHMCCITCPRIDSGWNGA
jgi:hypothetical protein